MFLILHLLFPICALCINPYVLLNISAPVFRFLALAFWTPSRITPYVCIVFGIVQFPAQPMWMLGHLLNLSE